MLACRPMRIVEKTQLMTATEIDRTIQRLAHEIVEKSGGTVNLALIGVRRRGVPLAKRISQAMRGIDGVDVPVGTLDITLYRDDLSKVAAQPVLQSSDIPFPVDDKDLVVVDDVLYTGRTIRAAMNGLFDLGRDVRGQKLDHLVFDLSNQPLKGVLRGISRGTRPPHHRHGIVFAVARCRDAVASGQPRDGSTLRLSVMP